MTALIDLPAGQVGIEEGTGVQQEHADPVDLLGDGSKNGFGILLLETQEDGRGLEVGAQTMEQATRCDLAGHDGVADAELPEGLQHLSELAHMEDAALGLGETADEFRQGFVDESNQANRDAKPAEGLRGQDRVDPVPGDHRNRFGAVEIIRQKA